MTTENTVQDTELEPLTSQQIEQEFNGIGQAIAAHEQTIFHLIVAVNAIQSLMISKGVVLDTEMQAVMKTEAEKLSALYVKHLEKNNAVPEVPANDSGLILP